MSEYVTGFDTVDGVKRYDYNALANLPESIGLNPTAAALLITVLRNGVFTSNQSANIAALEAALASSGGGGETPDVPDVPDEPDVPEVTLTSISATYSGGDVAVDTALTELTGIVVTAHYSDGSTTTVTDYTLSGTIAEGENIITVSYGGKSTTFAVTGKSSENADDVAVPVTYTYGYKCLSNGPEVANGCTYTSPIDITGASAITIRKKENATLSFVRVYFVHGSEDQTSGTSKDLYATEGGYLGSGYKTEYVIDLSSVNSQYAWFSIHNNGTEANVNSGTIEIILTMGSSGSGDNTGGSDGEEVVDGTVAVTWEAGQINNNGIVSGGSHSSIFDVQDATKLYITTTNNGWTGVNLRTFNSIDDEVGVGTGAIIGNGYIDGDATTDNRPDTMTFDVSNVSFVCITLNAYTADVAASSITVRKE